MKPCDCTSTYDTQKMDVQGIKTGSNGIEVIPNYVLLEIGPATVKIPMSHFKMFAKWYLSDCPKEGEGNE